MTLWIIVGSVVLIAFLVAGQKAANAKRERDHATALAEWKAKVDAEKAKADAQATAQADYDAIVEPRRARWAAWNEEAKRLTADVRANPPQDLHRIVWEPSSHSYKVMRWWVGDGKPFYWADGNDDDVAGDYIIQPRKVGTMVKYEEVMELVRLRDVALGHDRPAIYRRYTNLSYIDRAEPPAKAQAIQGYQPATEKRFASVKEAEHWLFLELHPDETQYGYNMDGRHVTDEVVPLPRPTIQGLPSLVLGSAGAVVNDSDVDLSDDAGFLEGPRQLATHRVLGRTRLSTRYKDL